jgi:hypothetical protein
VYEHDVCPEWAVVTEEQNKFEDPFLSRGNDLGSKFNGLKCEEKLKIYYS